MDTSAAAAWIFNTVIAELVLFGVIWMFVSWRYRQMLRGNKMVAEIWRSNGFPTRHLAKIEDNGKTVQVDDCTYFLAREEDEKQYQLADEEKKERADRGITKTAEKRNKPYPIKRWAKWPEKPFLGMGSLQRTLRLESWEEDNPEPMRPYYGTITAEGLFVGHLHATASEVTSLKNEAEAAGLVGQIEEARARQEITERALANQPNKTYVYIGLVIAIVAAGVAAFMSFQAAGGIDTILSGWGLK